MLESNVRLSDLIEIPDIRLVIELDDADRDPNSIADTFVLTHEVERGIRSILERIDSHKGCGTFIKGNFGSGKSHFLSFLYLLLRDKGHPILKDYERIKATTFQIIKISLIRYPSSLSLEGILLQCLDYSGRVSDRETLYRELFKTPSVIIIDELSEFLRSKVTPAQFYEDVRFLQFLGEFSMRHPLWVIASLQEWIEETGYISSSIFNRIKDRYPLRINLTSSHIEDIIDQRLIKKKEGSSEVIREIFDELRRFYPFLELRFDRFKKTFPLHPFTTRFLSGLTRIFSQHRGVIQFVQSEVLKRKEDPPDSLITPEAIFDHFEDRLREIPELSSFARVVYDYYRNNLSSIFNNPSQRAIAESVIKLLILTELSPLEKRKTAKDIAEMLLKKISTVTDSINYDFIKNGILEPLVAHQMYITKEGESYFIDISQDEGIRIKARIKAIRERFSDRGYLFLEIANLISLPYLPLRDIKEGRRYRFIWQNSARECVVLISSGLDRDDLERFSDSIKKRVDGYFIILSPFHPLSLSTNLFTDSSLLSLILLWQPREFTEEEMVFVEEYVAKTMLLNDFPSLREDLKTLEPLLRDIITRVYFDGKIMTAEGKETPNIKDLGYLPMERLLGHLFDLPLRQLYPYHQKIMPRIDMYSVHHVANLFNYFIKQGRLTIEEAEKKGLIPYIKGLLEPLGIVAKRGSAYTLHISPDNEVISYILDLITHEKEASHDLYNIRQSLRKSKWGMGDDQINILLSSLIVSGYIVPYGRQGEMDFRDISQLSSGEIISIKIGKAIEPELIKIIPRGRFIWGDTETAPGAATIKSMWKEAAGFIRRYRRLLEELQSMINRYKEYTVFRFINLDMPLLNRLSLFVHSIGLNMSPQEGIERFLSFLKENENLEGQISYIERLFRFFNEEFQLINKYYLYLIHPSLKIGHELNAVKVTTGQKDSLEANRESLIRDIEESLRGLSDLEDVRRRWTEFYDSYCTLYKDHHDRFYEAPIFGLKIALEDFPVARVLKRIAYIVSSITFEKEWWEIKRMIEGLPERCRADLNQELFLKPVCSCGFQIGMTPPDFDTDIEGLCEVGIRNFLRTIQSPDNREKIDSSITGLSLSGKKDISERLLQVISINPEKAGISQIKFLLDDEVLQEIENAFKGRWRIKEVILEDLVETIKGRRFRYDELRQIILNWIGDDTESIIHIRNREGGEEIITEELSIYGIEGKKAQMSLLNTVPLRDEDLLKVFDTINLKGFDTSRLIEFLRREKNDYMKKRLRNELFERFWSLKEEKGGISDIDKPMEHILKAIHLIRRYDVAKGVEIFTNILAPLSNILGWLFYENINDRIIDHDLLQILWESFSSLSQDYEKRPDKYEGIRDIGYIKERLKGPFSGSPVLVVIDGLRYDLWLIFKEVMINEGWRLNDHVFRIDIPSTTYNFRNCLGIDTDTGTIDGKEYTILKVAEKEIGKRNLRKFLKDEQGLKVLHFNFIDARIHGSTLDLYPLYEIIKREFTTGIVPILKEMGFFYLVSDHGFIDTGDPLKDRYRHGGGSIWETVLPFAEIRL